MAIVAERDAAIRERNMALEERKRAFAERDMAVLQRDAAIAECNSVIQERDEAIAALSEQESSLNKRVKILDSTTQEKHNNIWQQMQQIKAVVSYRGDLISDNDTFNLPEVVSQAAKPRRARQPKESKLTRSAKFPRTGERGAERAEESRRPAHPATSSGWGNTPDVSNRNTWKDNSTVNEIKFDDSVMPAPVCTCTGSPQPCYRWGNGGWQSACCTTRISMYPLPQVSNKRYTRVGGRKMSGSAFGKLLNRLACEGYNLSTPVDLKDHWAKHGTNRYATVK